MSLLVVQWPHYGRSSEPKIQLSFSLLFCSSTNAVFIDTFNGQAWWDIWPNKNIFHQIAQFYKLLYVYNVFKFHTPTSMNQQLVLTILPTNNSWACSRKKFINIEKTRLTTITIKRQNTEAILCNCGLVR